MAPLNTPDGQRYIDALIKAWGGFDLVIFDNIQALCPGDQKDTLAWSGVLDWTKSLSYRRIGQIWVHHTSANDKTKAYGDSTRQWQMDTVIRLQPNPCESGQTAFKLDFDKKRLDDGRHASAYRTVDMFLADGEWSVAAAAKPSPTALKVRAALVEWAQKYGREREAAFKDLVDAGLTKGDIQNHVKGHGRHKADLLPFLVGGRDAVDTTNPMDTWRFKLPEGFVLPSDAAASYGAEAY